MAWFVALVLIMFYILGQYVLYAGPGTKLLPLVALLVIVIEVLVSRVWRRRSDSSSSKLDHTGDT